MEKQKEKKEQQKNTKKRQKENKKKGKKANKLVEKKKEESKKILEEKKEVEKSKKRSYNWIKIFIILGIISKGIGYIYETYTVPENEIQYNNSIEKDSKFSVSLVLVNSKNQSINRKILDENLEYNLSEKNNLIKKIKLEEKEFKNIKDLKFQLLVEFKDKKGKKEVNFCQSNLTEILPELKNRNNSEMKIEGVYKKKGKKKLHFKSKLFFSLIYDENKYTQSSITFKQLYKNTLKNQKYLPFMDCLQYWTLRRDKLLVENFNTKNLPEIEIEFNITWIFKFEKVLQLYLSEQQTDSFFQDANVFEEFKEILVDNSFYYLVILFGVNFLHTIFSFLAIKTRISFWNNLRSNKGLSLRKYYSDCIFQIVIILYLIDNDSSFLVTFFAFMEFLVSSWIAIKVSKFEKRPDNKFPYYQLEKPKDNFSKQSLEYDKTATNFMSKLLLPFLFGFTIYNFIKNENLGIYSFILQTLVSFIYVLGFIYMTPQIYINYKLKNVENLPWKSMIYQFLNTIIDDLFAFAVKMPVLQKISVFRDDIIFVVYIYQMWIYRNNKREDENKEKEEKVKTE